MNWKKTFWLSLILLILGYSLSWFSFITTAESFISPDNFQIISSFLFGVHLFYLFHLNNAINRKKKPPRLLQIQEYMVYFVVVLYTFLIVSELFILILDGSSRSTDTIATLLALIWLIYVGIVILSLRTFSLRKRNLGSYSDIA